MGSLEITQKDSCFSEKLVTIYQPEWCHTLENGNLQMLGTYMNATWIHFKSLWDVTTVASQSIVGTV
jgi:hypothetical protein